MVASLTVPQSTLLGEVQSVQETQSEVGVCVALDLHRTLFGELAAGL